jgi:4-amino-4-deoxy-L-arabinose transferase-like glycosyltransferase
MKPNIFSTLGLILLVLLVLGLFTIRLMAPSDLMDKDQERPASYVLDALENGHWICQIDWLGSITSKPPLYTWLSACLALPFDRFNRFALYMPSALSVLFLALVIRASGGKRFSPAAGFFGAILFVLSPISARLTVMARTDSLFTFMIVLTALSAFRSWEKGGGWIWFWLAAAAATLTKGPLGLLIGAMGLSAVYWENHRGTTQPLRGAQLTGIVLFLLLTLGWFALACLDMGRSVVDKMIFSELFSQGVRASRETVFQFDYFKPSIYFLHRFAPWSVVACIGLWRVFRRPSTDGAERRFERFLTCWLLGGLIIFSLAPHQRGDLVYPIIPPAAMLAGREMGKWFAKLSPKAILTAVSAFSAIIFCVFAYYYLVVRTTEPLVIRTEGMRELAKEIRSKARKDVPLLHVDDPYSLQFFLNTMKTVIPPEEAARLLAETNPVYVAVCNLTSVTARLSPTPIHTVARWPKTGEAVVTILGNQSTLTPALSRGEREYESRNPTSSPFGRGSR